MKKPNFPEPILAAACTLSFAAALMSILALQTAMITKFGGGADFACTMNTIAGAVIAGLLIGAITDDADQKRRYQKALQNRRALTIL